MFSLKTQTLVNAFYRTATAWMFMHLYSFARTVILPDGMKISNSWGLDIGFYMFAGFTLYFGLVFIMYLFQYIKPKKKNNVLLDDWK